MIMANVCNFLARRRRFIVLKLTVVIFIFMTFLLWSKVQQTGDHVSNNNNNNHEPQANYQKADPPVLRRHHRVEESNQIGDRDWRKPEKEHNSIEEFGGGSAVFKSKNKIPYALESLRKKVLTQNTDEFLTPVLRDFPFHEVDLISKRNPDFADYDAEIKDDEHRIKPGLGDKGNAATVPSHQEEVAEEVMKKEAFNRILSEMISPNRSAPDTREAACRSEVYDATLPDMSVVIIFTNEAFTSLVRTLHSVINRTPPELLKEIILVDDFSDSRDLKGKFERYVATKFEPWKIRLIRLEKRSGLIRARMIGAHLAVGDVLLFLDAHCEATEGWAEPLLQRIKEDRKAVVCPIIDVIDDKTMEYYHGNGAFFQIGGFTWSGHFTWINIPQYEADRKKQHHLPTRSPTMAGGLFAMDRKYFWEVGSYDSDMQLWGGENLEMSFRIWQCGGSVEIIPCSRVGHIFRNFHPYSFPNNVDSHGLNTARLAEVWMDEYKDLFYAHRKELKHAPYGDVSKRIAFRKRMNCKSFKWYLENIYKEKFRMWFDAKAYGQVKNPESNQCLDNMQHSESEEYALSLYPCHSRLYPSQTFLLSTQGELRREAECASSTKDSVQMVQCEHLRHDDRWEYNPENGQLYNVRVEKCLTVDRADRKNTIMLETCRTGSSAELQRWVFDPHKGEATDSQE